MVWLEKQFQGIPEETASRPEEVGFGSFYRGITDWVEGADLDSVLQEIDASWGR